MSENGKGLEFSTVMTVSSKELSDSTLLLLAEEQETNYMGLTMYDKIIGNRRAGVYIYLSREALTAMDFPHIPSDLKSCVDYARQNNADILCVDEGMPQYHVEKSRMLTMSTAHVSERTRAFLDSPGAATNMGLAVCLKAGFGWFIYVGQKNLTAQAEAMLPEDLRKCIKFARGYNTDTLCLDCDMPAASDPCLDVYED